MYYMAHKDDYCLYFSLEIPQVAVDVIEVLMWGSLFLMALLYFLWYFHSEVKEANRSYVNILVPFYASGKTFKSRNYTEKPVYKILCLCYQIFREMEGEKLNAN